MIPKLSILSDAYSSLVLWASLTAGRLRPPLGSPRTPNYAGRAQARQRFVALLLVRRCESSSSYRWDERLPRDSAC
jgi:hypothetical protein